MSTCKLKKEKKRNQACYYPEVSPDSPLQDQSTLWSGASKKRRFPTQRQVLPPACLSLTLQMTTPTFWSNVLGTLGSFFGSWRSVTAKPKNTDSTQKRGERFRVSCPLGLGRVWLLLAARKHLGAPLCHTMLKGVLIFGDSPNVISLQCLGLGPNGILLTARAKVLRWRLWPAVF